MDYSLYSSIYPFIYSLYSFSLFLQTNTYTPNPESPESCENGCYRYILYELKEADLRVVVRAHLVGYRKVKDEYIYVAPHALLEYDTAKTKWKFLFFFFLFKNLPFLLEYSFLGIGNHVFDTLSPPL